MSRYGYLVHHGIKGQKWGIRRYQNSDGSLTPEGRRYYGINERRAFKEARKNYLSNNKQLIKDARNSLKGKSFGERKDIKRNIRNLKADRTVVKTGNKKYLEAYMNKTDPERKKILGQLINESSDMEKAKVSAATAVSVAAIKALKALTVATVSSIIIASGKEFVMNSLDNIGVDDIFDVIDMIKK